MCVVVVHRWAWQPHKHESSLVPPPVVPVCDLLADDDVLFLYKIQIIMRDIFGLLVVRRWAACNITSRKGRSLAHSCFNLLGVRALLRLHAMVLGVFLSWREGNATSKRIIIRIIKTLATALLCSKYCTKSSALCTRYQRYVTKVRTVPGTT